MLLYIEERIEELRSRLSLVESTLRTIEQDIWSTFSSAMNNGVSPPIIYPASTFRRLSSFLEAQKISLNRIRLDSPLLLIIQRLNDLNNNTNDLLTEIMRLQNVLSQRTAGTDMDKIIEYKASSQEFCMFSKSYDAVDALTYELVERILGLEWIKRQKYCPISLFDYSGYMINLRSYIISIPYHDSFRSRFWPSLAHEVGHVFVYESSKTHNSLDDIILGTVEDLERLLGFRPSEFGVYDSATNQLIELAADAISAYVCPPAFLSAASLLGIPFESAGSSNGALARFFKYSDHPPFDTRLLLMKNVLHLTDGLNQNQLFAEHANRVVTFIGRKNLVGLTPISFEFLEDYEDLCKDFCWDVIRSLPALGIKKFERSDWASVRDAIIKQDYTPLSPVQLLNGWLA